MTDQHNAMHRRVTRLAELLEVDVCTLYRAFPGERELEISATFGLDQQAVGARLDYDSGLTGKVARSAGPVAARIIQDHPEYFHVEGSGEERFRSYLGIPLEQEDRLFGVLVIQTTVPRTFFRRDIRELYAAGRDLLPALVEECTVT